MLPLVLPMFVLLSGCVAARLSDGPAARRLSGAPADASPQPAARVPGGDVADRPVGQRHDARAGIHGVQVLMPDGAVVTGAVVGASSQQPASPGRRRRPGSAGDRRDARRPREGTGTGAVRDGVEGAAWGAGIVGVVGLDRRPHAAAAAVCGGRGHRREPKHPVWKAGRATRHDLRVSGVVAGARPEVK